MQGGYNLFFIAISNRIWKAKEAISYTDEDFQYNNGYLQGLKDSHELALEIRHGEDYYE